MKETRIKGKGQRAKAKIISMKRFFTSRVTLHASLSILHPPPSTPHHLLLATFHLLLAPSFFLLALSACSPATPNATPAPNSTAFIATRVVEVLTQNAM